MSKYYSISFAAAKNQRYITHVYEAKKALMILLFYLEFGDGPLRPAGDGQHMEAAREGDVP